MLVSNQEIVTFVCLVDAMIDDQLVYETPIQVEISDWLAKLYWQIERDLGRMEKFMHNSHTTNQNAAEILSSLVKEYQMLLKT
jgi:hypothetical protein